MMEVRIESGMETAMMSVLRQLPRNSRIIAAVRQAAITASRMTPLTAARTKIDWSARGWTLSSGGRVGITRGSMARMPPTTSRVDAERPVFKIVTSVPAACRPAARRSSWARSRRARERRPADRWSSCRPPDREVVQLGPRSGGLAFIATSYSNSPIFAVPDGSTMFCRPTAVTTRHSGRSLWTWSRLWVQVDHDLALLAAVRIRDGRAGHGHELGPQKIEVPRR